MTQLTDIDVHDLEELFSTTELIASAGQQWMNATSLSTGHAIYYYVVAKGRSMDVFKAHDIIQAQSQWAVIHDYDQDRFEVWVDGTKFGNLREDELIPELARCLADARYR